MPLNPSFSAQQVISALAHLQASHFLIGTETKIPRKRSRENVSLLKQIVPDLQKSRIEAPSIPSLKDIILVDNSEGRVDMSLLRTMTDWRQLLDDGSREPLDILELNLDAEEVVNIQFTSGTTSAPKAACLTHRSILNNGFSIGNRMLLTSTDMICCPPPLFHCFGSILGYMASATHGSCIVFPSEAFDPVATLKAVQEERCSALYGVPTMFISELELIQSGQVSSGGFEQLRTGIAAGSSIPAELMRKLHKTLNLTELTICYGMTETSPVSAMTTTADPLEKRINTVGRPLDHVECKIVHPQDRSQILPIGQRGELAVAGYLVMRGYWNDPAQSAEVMLRDEIGKTWMHTGDEAVMDEEGYVAITGRLNDIIIRGGENIHPLEIENCLLAHPDVQQVAVVGVPDEKYGEVVAAFVTLRSDATATSENLQTWVHERLSFHLGKIHEHVLRNRAAHTKCIVPRYVFWTSTYPKTASGKIKRFELIKQAIELLRRVDK